MAKRNDKKKADLINARNFIGEVIDQLERHYKTKQMKSAIEEYISKIPKFNTQPSLTRKYTDILTKISSGSCPPNIAISYFQREDIRLRREIENL